MLAQHEAFEFQVASLLHLDFERHVLLEGHVDGIRNELGQPLFQKVHS